jgi:hypothetical protein
MQDSKKWQERWQKSWHKSTLKAHCHIHNTDANHQKKNFLKVLSLSCCCLEPSLKPVLLAIYLVRPDNESRRGVSLSIQPYNGTRVLSLKVL